MSGNETKIVIDSFSSLSDWSSMLLHRYGPRNRIVFPGYEKRIVLLTYAVRSLQKGVRQGKINRVPARLSTVATTCIALANSLEDSNLIVRAMAQKFHSVGCSYCQHNPCICTGGRPPFQKRNIDENQYRWSIAMWQEHLDLVYGKCNQQMGIGNILGRLYEEIAEVNLHCSGFLRTAESDDLEVWREEFALECADVFSWTIAVAVYYGFDLHKAMVDEYGQFCPSCEKDVCGCPIYNVHGGFVSLVGVHSTDSSGYTP